MVVSPVEQVPVDTFLELGAGDFLFIDTSHTVKTGGDVVFLLQEVLPRLAEGVIIHIHDISFRGTIHRVGCSLGGRGTGSMRFGHFLPSIQRLRSSSASPGMSHFQSDILASALPAFAEKYGHGGGWLWIRHKATL